MRHPLQPLTFLIATAPFQLGAQVDNAPEEYSSSDWATSAIFTGSNLAPKKLAMAFQHMNAKSDAFHRLSKDIAIAAIETVSTMSLKTISVAFASLMSCIPPYTWIFTVANICHTFYIHTHHVKQRDYTFVAPVAGRYQLKVWVPGDWLKPRSIIVVHSADDGATQLQYRYDQQNTSDRTESIDLDLPAGLTQISISVGRATLLTHTSGHLVNVTLENDFSANLSNVEMAGVVAETIDDSPDVGMIHSLSLELGIFGDIQNLLNGTFHHAGSCASPNMQFHVPAA